MAGPLLDSYLLYQFLRRLVVPFTDLDAYKFGLIDKDGKRLRKPQTKEERDSDRPFDRLVLNLKRIMALIPPGRTYLGTVAMALFLLREQDHALFWLTRPMGLQEALDRIMVSLSDNSTPVPAVILEMLAEDAPTNAAGRGQVAGIGVGPQGEPGVFAGHKVFDVDPNKYYKARMGKKKYSNYRHWVSEDAGAEVTDYATKNPDKGIILRNNTTGAMMFLRRPKFTQGIDASPLV